MDTIVTQAVEVRTIIQPAWPARRNYEREMQYREKVEEVGLPAHIIFKFAEPHLEGHSSFYGCVIGMENFDRGIAFAAAYEPLEEPRFSKCG